jgi:hypothetical protein
MFSKAKIALAAALILGCAGAGLIAVTGMSSPLSGPGQPHLSSLASPGHARVDGRPLRPGHTPLFMP